MKKSVLIYSLIACMILPMVVLVTSAHSGRTDGSGGHRNHSTGEYHYHHGYSAHDHYDMDGDGHKDCPYDFDDKTDHNSDKISDGTRNDITKHKSDSKQSQHKGLLSAIYESLSLAIFIWLPASYLISYITLSIFKNDKGCLVAIIIGAIVAIGVGICVFVYKLS